MVTQKERLVERLGKKLLYHYGTQGFNETPAGQGCQDLPEF